MGLCSWWGAHKEGEFNIEEEEEGGRKKEEKEAGERRRKKKGGKNKGKRGGIKQRD